MTNLNCDVTNCINNKSNLCTRANIKVDGCDATCESQTRCLSFGRRGSSYENAVSANMDPAPETDITCDVKNCTYNCTSRCTAQNVQVCGCEACTCSETQCKTFEAR